MIRVPMPPNGDFPREDSLCEACGYALRGLRPEQDCPECGLPVDASHPRHRPGLPWQREMSWNSFWRTWWMVVSRPRESFRRMRVGSDVWQAGMSGNFYVSCLFLAGTVIAVGASCRLWLRPDLPRDPGLAFVWLLISIAALMLLTALETRGVKFFSARRGWTGAAREAAYITHYAAPGWVLASIGWSVGWIAVNRFSTTDLTILLGYPLSSYLNFLVFFLGLLCFEILVYLGVRQVRFANPPLPDTPDPRTPRERDSSPPDSPDSQT